MLARRSELMLLKPSSWHRSGGGRLIPRHRFVQTLLCSCQGKVLPRRRPAQSPLNQRLV